MKSIRFPLLIGFALTAPGLAHGFDLTKPFARTDVVFFEPQNFTDVRDSSLGDSESARSATLGELRTYVTKQANRFLTPGQQLKITVTDVDLAGEFEPWRGAQWGDVRVVKDIYPPRATLSFQLIDADGQVIKQGDRQLRDLAFMMKLSINRDDPLRHEKALFDDWLSLEFRGLKKR